MLERSLVNLLWRPSLLSGAVCGLLVVAVLGVRSWELILHAPITSSALLGPGNIIVVAIQSVDYFSGMLASFLAQPLFYYVALGAVSVVVTVVVYAVLQSATGLAGNVAQTLAEAHNSGKKINRTFAESFGLRLLVRLVIAVLAVGYWQLAVMVILPWLLGLWDVGAVNLHAPLGWANCAFVVTALAAVLHIFVVLLRLLFLRPRVFGGTYQILEALD